MNFTVTAIEESLRLLQTRAMPARTKIVIAANLSAAKKIIKHDPFHAIRCEFFIKSHLESLVHNLQMIKEGTQTAEEMLGVVADSCSLLLFLGVSSSDGQTVTSLSGA